MKQYAKLRTYIFEGSERIYLKDCPDIELVPIDSKHYGVFARETETGQLEYDICSLLEFDEYDLKKSGWKPIIKNETHNTCVSWLKENIKKEVIYQIDNLVSYNY